MNTVAPDDDREAARGIMAMARHGRQALLIDEEIFPRDAATCTGNVMQRLLRVFTAR